MAEAAENPFRFLLLGRVQVAGEYETPVFRGNKIALDRFGSAYWASRDTVFATTVSQLLVAASRYDKKDRGKAPSLDARPAIRFDCDILSISFSRSVGTSALHLLFQ
jgi:hypothetical protein